MIRFLLDNLPAPLRTVVRGIGYFLLETSAAVSGRDDYVPPSWLSLTGEGDFRVVGNEFLRYFIELGRLMRDDHVLDVGCGLGRMALPLIDYLDPAKGRYIGFDVDKQAIRWCQRRISLRYPNFRFQHADIFNRFYHRSGRVDGAIYHFPYGEESFDFVISTSVFTHMLPPDVENYLTEIARVLRPGGRCLMTFFLLNPESVGLMNSGHSKLNLSHNCGTYRLLNPKIPEAAIAHNEGKVRDWCSTHGLSIVEPVHYGSWCGRPRYLSYQDVIIGEKVNHQ